VTAVWRGGGNLTGASPRAEPVQVGPLREVTGMTHVTGATVGAFTRAPGSITRAQGTVRVPPPPSRLELWIRSRFTRPQAAGAPMAPAQDSYVTPASVIRR
jgi:hypothetical protein